MSRVYLTPLPDSQASTSDEGVRTQIQQSGLLQEGGTAVEKIAQDNIDLVVSGNFNFGATFSEKVADELESLSESTYNGLPFFTPSAPNGGRNVGYYELERVDVSPSHPVNQDAFEYTAAFTFTGTRETDWSAVQTNIEDVQTGLATGTNARIGLPAGASKTKWFGVEEGTESATAESTVTAEFGNLDRYDPQDTSIVNPILLYELPYTDAGSVDVRVFDDRGLAKYYEVEADSTTVSTSTQVGTATVSGTKQRVSQWTHVYHTSFEFDGAPVVDNGRLRLRFDEANGVVEAYEWDTAEFEWSQLTVSHGDYELVDADFEEIGATDTRVYTEWVDTGSDTLEQAIISVQRGLDRAIARYPPDTTQTAGLESVLSAFVGDYATDPKPTRTLKSRGEVK